MAEIEIISERPISLFGMKKNLDEIKKRDKEISVRAKKTDEYINTIIKTRSKKIKEIREALEKTNITRLKPKHIAKLIDIQPKDMDSLKIIFSSESITLKQEDLDKILEVMKKNV